MIMMSTLTEALSSLLEMNYLPVYEFFSNPPNDYYGTGNVVSRVAYMLCLVLRMLHKHHAKFHGKLSFVLVL